MEKLFTRNKRHKLRDRWQQSRYSSHKTKLNNTMQKLKEKNQKIQLQ